MGVSIFVPTDYYLFSNRCVEKRSRMLWACCFSCLRHRADVLPVCCSSRPTPSCVFWPVLCAYVPYILGHTLPFLLPPDRQVRRGVLPEGPL